MPRYIREITRNMEYPDLSLVGQSVIHVKDMPDFIVNDEQSLNQLQNDLTNMANKAGLGFNQDLVAEVHVRKGSLLVDIFFNCELATLLSADNLKLLQVWVGDNAVIKGVELGSEAYVAHLTFRSIRRLERAMKRVCDAIKGYVLIQIFATKHMIKNDSNTVSKGEGRTGVLGLLSRLYDAVDVCRGTASIERKVNAISRARNVIKTLDDIVSSGEDRMFLCELILPIVKEIPDYKIESTSVAENVEYYMNCKKDIMQKMNFICEIKEI